VYFFLRHQLAAPSPGFLVCTFVHFQGSAKDGIPSLFWHLHEMSISERFLYKENNNKPLVA
jgi:hypothetical protein